MAELAQVPNIDLSQEIADWQSAIYGEEVRAANVAAFKKIQGSVNSAIQNVNIVAVTSQQAVDDANNAIETANQTEAAAATSASQAAASAAAAAGSEEESAQSALDAAQSAAAAANQADRAELYAGVVAPQFTVDFATGELVYNSAQDITFMINGTSGDLEYTFTAAA